MRPPVERQSIEEATKEAETRSLEYDPTVRARYIREMLHDIPIMLKNGLSEEQIRNKVPQFAEKYAELFKKIVNKQDLTPIHSMLALLDKMSEGRINQHQASVVIGKKLADTYITPKLNATGSKK